LEKILKILPRLNSENDNEIIASIGAIKRILKSNGKTFHDFADVISIKSPKPYYGHFQYKPTYEKPDLSEQEEMANFINENDVTVSEWEANFWEDIQDRIYKYKLTEKQMNIVKRIYERAKK